MRNEGEAQTRGSAKKGGEAKYWKDPKKKEKE
jgi:hypothetical protein